MLQRLKNIGPGAMVAAAFIGPGTVTTATIAGASYGYTLLWAVLFSIIASCILQEMSARLGVVGKMGIGKALRQKINKPIGRFIVILLVISAIFIGNAAYEAGNISGVALGSQLISEQNGNANFAIPVFIGIIAAVLLFTGKYKLIERFLIFLVGIMGIVFLIVAFNSGANILSVLKGLFVPEIPEGAGLTVIGLIGTTVVPYNLFLHASSASRKWTDEKDLRSARFDTILSIAFGGLITVAILVSVAALQEGNTISTIDRSALGEQLKPLLGKSSSFFVGAGFMAAGLSSAITAPLAAAFASSEILGWSENMKSLRFRLIWIVVLICGVCLAIFPTYKAETIILFAQVANGLILPLIAGFLLWIMNDANILGQKRNSIITNTFGVFIVLITLLLGLKSILSAFDLI